MPVGEIIVVVSATAKLVNDTRQLINAINDGREYLARHHPDAKKDLTEMLAQMQMTVQGLADVTAVVTSFKFTVKGPAVAHEPARFNAYVVDQNKKVAALRENISKLKGSSGKVRKARDQLSELAGKKGNWKAWLLLLGEKQRKRDADLANTLSNFYADDQRIIDSIRDLLKLSQVGLKEADKALGPPSQATPDRVVTAATVLGIYATAFVQQQKDLDDLVTALEDSLDALNA